MNKVTLTAVSDAGVPTFASAPYSPDNSQNARRFMTTLACDEFAAQPIQVEVSELTAPSDAKGGPAKVVARVRYSVPQLKLASSQPSSNCTSLAMTGQSEYLQATLTVTIPAIWAKLLLSAVPASDAIKLKTAALIRAAAMDALNGVFGDVKPSTTFPSASWTTALPTTCPLYRALQGANPEDVFNGSYGAT